MLDDEMLKRILGSENSIWLRNGVIMGVVDIKTILENKPLPKNKVLPLNDIIDSIISTRSVTNGAEREFIDGHLVQTANMLVGKSESQPYGALTVTADERWQREYTLAKIALVMRQVKTAFALNGNGIDAVSAYIGDHIKTVIISHFPYDLSKFRIAQVAPTNRVRSERGSSTLMMGEDLDVRCNLDLVRLFGQYFPKQDKVCSHAGGSCSYEVESLKSQCYDGSFGKCDIFKSCQYRGK